MPIYYFLVSLCQESWDGLIGISVQDPIGPLKVLCTAHSHLELDWGRLEESPSKFIQIDDRIHFLSGVRWSAQVSYWVLALARPNALEAACRLLPSVSLHRKYVTWQCASSSPFFPLAYF